MPTPSRCSDCSSSRARSPAAPPCTIAVSVTSSPSRRARQACLGQRAAYECVDPACRELHAREVDPRHEALGQQALGLPPHGLLAGLAQGELTELHDHAGGLGCRDELSRRDGAARRRGPAQQGLDTHDRSAHDLDLRLVVEREFVALQSESELVLEAERLPELARHLTAEDLVAAAARLLGGVHGDVGAADQLLAVPRYRRPGR